MKTLVYTFALTLVILTSVGSVAQAGFDEDDVREGAEEIRELALQTRDRIQSFEIDGLPLPVRGLFRDRLFSIAYRAQDIAALSNADDEDAVEDELMRLAREIQPFLTELTDRAEQRDHEVLLDILEELEELTDELVDDLD
jgi:hypothetical protein